MEKILLKDVKGLNYNLTMARVSYEIKQLHQYELIVQKGREITNSQKMHFSNVLNNPANALSENRSISSYKAYDMISQDQPFERNSFLKKTVASMTNYNEM